MIIISEYFNYLNMTF